MKQETRWLPDFQEVSLSVIRSKHALPHESAVAEVYARVARGLSDCREDYERFLAALNNGFVPGGRIMKGAGQANEKNLINCFVQPIADCIEGSQNGNPGIFKAAEMAAQTLRMGGGVGYDFSAIRPKGAAVKGNGAKASGPVAYMRMLGTLPSVVVAEDGRQAAQMAVLRCDHPDIYDFIHAKRAIDFANMGLGVEDAAVAQQIMERNPEFALKLNALDHGLASFNLSVGVTDEFMQAVISGARFDLVHSEPPADRQVPMKLIGAQAKYVYATIEARDLWNKILWNTYTGAEPGVLFLDTINRTNNLRDMEEIRACNPCGEQMLPSNGCCDVGSWNLSRFVINPFTEYAKFDFNRFEACVATSVQMLDRVLDKTKWPHAVQASEAQGKRRIGLGYFGLADVFVMLGVRYGSSKSLKLTDKIGRTLAHAAYRASIDLAKREGPFPLFNANEYLAKGTFASKLPKDIQDDIRRYGIRNSHLLCIAPTGTIALGFGNNASSGCEPIFSLSQRRYIMNSHGQRELVELKNAAYLHAQKAAVKIDPRVWVTTEDLSVDDHLNVLAMVARNVDSAVSKTVNVPVDYPFAQFQGVYMRAYELGLKGLTTYRPNPITGAVLSMQEPASNCAECDDGVCAFSA